MLLLLRERKFLEMVLVEVEEEELWLFLPVQKGRMRDLFVRFKSWASVVDCEARRGIVAAMRSPMSRIRNQEDEEGYISRYL